MIESVMFAFTRSTDDAETALIDSATESELASRFHVLGDSLDVGLHYGGTTTGNRMFHFSDGTVLRLTDTRVGRVLVLDEEKDKFADVEPDLMLFVNEADRYEYMREGNPFLCVLRQEILLPKLEMQECNFYRRPLQAEVPNINDLLADLESVH